MNPEEHFAPDPNSIRAVRRFVTAHLDAQPIDLDIVLLLVTELATNAVRHARSDFTVRLHHSPALVRVEVQDRNPNPPIIQPLNQSRPSGRGLQLLHALASAWGVEPRPPGKTIWFEHPI